MRAPQFRVTQWMREYDPSPKVRQTFAAAGIAVWVAVGSSAMWGLVQLLP